MQDKKQSHQALAELAARQYGVVSAPQLARLGWSRDKMAREARAGRLHRLHQGVYAVGHPGLSAHGRCMAAVLACGEGALLSHRSAAWLWGLVPSHGAEIDVTTTISGHHQASIRIHSAKTLTSDDLAVPERIPATAVPRTLLDLAATSPHRLSGALRRAERLGLVDLISLDALIRRCRGQRGVARLRLAIEDFREPAYTRSKLERRFLRLVREAGLPRPSTNLFIAGFELDAYWDELRFAVELDTYDHHGDPRAFEADRLRQEDLKLAGIEMTRVTGRRIDREPRAVAERLRRLLANRHRELHNTP